MKFADKNLLEFSEFRTSSQRPITVFYSHQSNQTMWIENALCIKNFRKKLDFDILHELKFFIFNEKKPFNLYFTTNECENFLNLNILR